MPTSTSWSALSADFHLFAATSIRDARRLERFQDWRPRARWLGAGEPPLCLLFVSHRWEQPDDPDPTARQLRALQRFVDLVIRCTAACVVAKDLRTQLLPALDVEGSLQALVVALRILDRDPLGQPFIAGPARRDEVIANATALGPETPAFADWLRGRIAVWIDYACVPQPPRTGDEARELGDTLRRLPELMRSSTLLALRYDGDNYTASGWCTTESFLGGLGGFARNVFVEVDRLLAGGPLYVPGGVLTESRDGADEHRVMRESYDLDLRGYTDDRDRLLGDESALATSSPPRVWSSYVSLLSSSFPPTTSDPRPTRRILELGLRIGETLVRNWLFTDHPVELDLGELVTSEFERVGLRCTVPADIIYLGLLVLSETKLRIAQPMLRAVQAASAAHRSTRIRLHPLDPDGRALLGQVHPSSPGTWHSRLTTGATRSDERTVVDQLVKHLEERPLRFELL